MSDQSPPILLIDDEEHLLNSYEDVLFSGGFSHAVLCNDAREAIPLLRQSGARIVLLDLMMPHRPGEHILKEISRDFPGTKVIVITGHGTTEDAVTAMKLGAFDFLTKPVTPERLIVTVKNAAQYAAMEQENLSLKQSLLEGQEEIPESCREIVTQDLRMFALFHYIEATAKSPFPILLTGETGVGKELFARAIYRAGNYPGAFTAVNVAGLDDQVFADTIFGHRKGAFTGADQPRSGMIEQADGGVLFLDEIGDLSPLSQVKLLRLLQEGEYFRLGEDRPRISTARIVCATNRPLEELVEQGSFRRDLYYRLYTHRIAIPPLRSRKGDLPMLIDHLARKGAALMNRPFTEVPAELVDRLLQHPFPGNIRELEAIIMDMVTRDFDAAFFPSRKDHVLSSVSQTATTVFADPIPTLDEVKRLLIEEALRRNDGNKTLVAGILGITRQTINRYT